MTVDRTRLHWLDLGKLSFRKSAIYDKLSQVGPVPTGQSAQNNHADKITAQQK